MQLCPIQFYQKIARKKVARVNAALISVGLYISIGWQSRIEWGQGLPVVNIIGNCCCTRVLLYAKMLKEARLFCHIFIIDGILIGGAGFLASLATPTIITAMVFVILRFCMLFCLFALVCMSKRH